MTGRTRTRGGRRAVVVLGVDVGTTNTKAALVTLEDDGTVAEVGTATEPTPDDAPGLAAAVGRVVRQVLESPGAAARGLGRPVRPDAIGIASMAETGVALTADGVPLTGLLRWDGHRAADQADRLARTLGADALFAATGVRPSAKVPLATLAWLREREVPVERWVGAADVVALALTGEAVTDHTLAGRTMAYRAVVDGPLPTSFDPDLLALVGMRPEQLPRVAAPDAVAGVVRRGSGPSGGALGGPIGGALRGPIGGALDGALGDVADLLDGVPVVVAGHDHAVGTWAAGVRRPGMRADSPGTAEAVLTVLERAPEPGPVAAAGMSWVRTASGRHHAVLAGSSSAGAMLGWLAERLAEVRSAEVRSAEVRADDDGVAAALAVAEHLAEERLAAVRAGGAGEVGRGAGEAGAVGRQAARDLVVLPYLAGRQTPSPDRAARVAVVADGVRLDPAQVRALASADPGRLALAVLDGVCLQARWMLTEQARLGDVAPTGPVTVVGGAARSVRAWAEVKQQVTGEPLTWVTAREPVAVGAAVLAAARAGLLGEPGAALDAAPVLPVQPGPAPDDGVARAAQAAFDHFRAAVTDASGR